MPDAYIHVHVPAEFVALYDREEGGDEAEEVVESGVKSLPPFSGLYSETVMWSLKVTECGMWETRLLLCSEEREWIPFRALNIVHGVCACVCVCVCVCKNLIIQRMNQNPSFQ